VTRRSAIVRAGMLALASAIVAAQAPPTFTHERQVVTAGGGPHRLAIDLPLLGAGAPFRVVKNGELATAEQGLSDLRLFADSGRPVPYLLMHPPSSEPEWVVGDVLTVPATKKTSGFELDLGSVQTVDRLRISDVPAPYLKRVTLEGSGDRARWTLLVKEGTLFDLPVEGLVQDALAFTPGPYRYLRVMWDDTNSGRLAQPRIVRARRVSPAAPSPAAAIQASVERRASEPGVSRFRVRLPAASLPAIALDVEIGGGHVYREAIVTESRFSGTEAAPVRLGSARLARVTRDGITASALRIPIDAPSEGELELRVDDGANAPLDVRGVSVVLAQLPWIYFEAPKGAVTARYGNKTLQRPSYDLEAVRQSVDLMKVREARWGDEQRLTEAGLPVEPSPLPNAGPILDPAAFQTVRLIEGKASGLVALRIDTHTLAYSRGQGMRFADVRVLNSENHQIPYILERRDEPLSIDLAISTAADAKAAELKPSPGRARTVYALKLPYPKLPPGTLVIETSARVFQRTTWVGVDRGPDRYRRDSWFDVKASQTWSHADAETPARPLTVKLDPMEDTDLRLVVDEGDNAPLPIKSVRLLLPSYRLRFYYPSQGVVLRLAYGRQDLSPPRYDLALLAPQVMGAAATEIGAAAPDAAARPEDRQFISRTLFWCLLGGAIIILLALIVRLVHTQT
jgi:uncharacterized protein DUF3999